MQWKTPNFNEVAETVEALVPAAALGLMATFSVNATKIVVPVMNECMRRHGELSSTPNKILSFDVLGLHEKLYAADISCQNPQVTFLAGGATVAFTVIAVLLTIDRTMSLHSRKLINQAKKDMVGKVLIYQNANHDGQKAYYFADQVAGVLIQKGKKLAADLIVKHHYSEKAALKMVQKTILESINKSDNVHVIEKLLAAIEDKDVSMLPKKVRGRARPAPLGVLRAA